MISYASISGMVMRHVYLLRRDINFLLAVFYWPLLDILMWGFLSSWIQQSNVTQFNNYVTTTLLGLILWQLIGRGCNIMVNAFCEELWSNNIVNLFSLPLRITEWMGAITVFTGIMMTFTSLFCMAVVFMLYDVSLWYFFSTFMLFMPPLFISCLWVGFTCLQIVVLLGRRGEALGFVFGWFLMPFSGVFYPVDVLPQWAQILSSFLPMSYLFQGMREYVMHHQNPTAYLIKGYVLATLYALCAMALFIYCFNRSKQKGLARLVS